MSACDNITFFFRPRFKCQLLSTSRSFSVNLLRVSLCQHYILLFVDPFSVLAFDNVTFFLHTRFALSICPLQTVSASTFCVSAFVHIIFFCPYTCFHGSLGPYYVLSMSTFLVSLSTLHYFVRPCFACPLCPRNALSMSCVHVLHGSLPPY